MAINTTSIKTVYPMDSAPPTEWQNGIPVYDRPYNAADLRTFMSLSVTDGVWPDYLDELSIEKRGTQWYLLPGAAMAGGLLIPFTDEAVLCSQSDIPTGRYAYVCVAARFDSDLRDGAAYARVSASPDPSPERTESVHELVLFRIDWRGTITDYRMNNSLCGPVSPVLQPDTESFMLELKTAVSQFNLNVGDVETLPSGTTPTVEVRKPEQAGGDVYIDFGIPRGAPGQPGKDGDSAPTMYVQDDEPPRVDGNVWMVDDRSTVPHAITAVRVYEMATLYPGTATFPGAGTFPGGSGAWEDHVFSPALFPGGGGGGAEGANLVTMSDEDPTSPGTPGDIHVNLASGEAFLYE